MSKSRIILILAAVLILAVGIYTAVQAAAVKGQKAPNFSAPDLSGRTTSLNNIRKDPEKNGATRVVLLDFFATWCPPCQEEIPHLQKLYDKYRKQGFVIVGIAGDKDGAKAVKPFVRKYKLTYPLLTDVSGKVQRTYGVRGYPTLYLIDKEGVIRSTHIGYTPGLERNLENEIKALLK